jgi:hypothetical protein
MKLSKKTLSLNTLKEDFKIRFDQAKETEKEVCIIKEIKAVKNSFKQKFKLTGEEIRHEMVNTTFNADYEAFCDYLDFWHFLPDLSNNPLHHKTALQKQNGVTLARYYEYLLQTREEYLWGVDGLDDEENDNPIELQEDKASEKSNVRLQLQMLYFLGAYEKIKNTGTVEKKGFFLSHLLNRNPQRARKPFSSKSILFHKDKAEAKNIRRDLETVHKLFYDFGLRDEALKVKDAIATINKTHFPEDL